MRLSFVRDSRPVYLGGRSLGVGRLRLRWGGKWYLVSPITFINAMGFAATVADSRVPTLLDAGPLGVPPLLGRALVPLLVDDWLDGDYPYLQRSTDAQVVAVLVAAAEVNGWDALQKLVQPRPMLGKRPDAGALDRTVVAIAEAFGLWPQDVMRKPHAEVQAVVEALNYNPDDAEISDESAAEVKRLAAEQEKLRGRHA